MIITLYTIKEINNGVSLLSFENKTERDKFFNSLTPVYKTSLDTVLLDSDTVLLDKPYYSLYKCNYAKINDTDNNIVIYAYIDVTQYTNTEVSRVTYTVDNITTYMYDDYRLIGSYKRRHLNRFLKDGSINIEDFRYEEDTNLTATKEELHLYSAPNNLYLCIVCSDNLFGSLDLAVSIDKLPYGVYKGYITFIFPYGDARPLFENTYMKEATTYSWCTDKALYEILFSNKKDDFKTDAIIGSYIINVGSGVFEEYCGFASPYTYGDKTVNIVYSFGNLYDTLYNYIFKPFKEYETNEPKLNLYPYNFTKFKLYTNEFTFKRQYYRVATESPYIRLNYSLDESKGTFLEFNGFGFEYYQEGGAVFNYGADASISVSQVDYKKALKDIASWESFGANSASNALSKTGDLISGDITNLVGGIASIGLDTLAGAISTASNNAIERELLEKSARKSVGNGNNISVVDSALFIPQLAYYSLYDYQIKEMEAYFDLFGYSYKAQFNYNSRLIEDNRTRTYYNYVQASAFNLFISLNQSNKSDIITRFMNGIILYHVRDNKIVNEIKHDDYNEEYNMTYNYTYYKIYVDGVLTYEGKLPASYTSADDVREILEENFSVLSDYYFIEDSLSENNFVIYYRTTEPIEMRYYTNIRPVTDSITPFIFGTGRYYPDTFLFDLTGNKIKYSDALDNTKKYNLKLTLEILYNNTAIIKKIYEKEISRTSSYNRWEIESGTLNEGGLNLFPSVEIIGTMPTTTEYLTVSPSISVFNTKDIIAYNWLCTLLSDEEKAKIENTENYKFHFIINSLTEVES